MSTAVIETLNAISIQALQVGALLPATLLPIWKVIAWRSAIIQALEEVYDPEIPINIYDLGLIYDIKIDWDGKVEIQMTLTAAACPFAQTLPGTVENAVNSVPGIIETLVELVWDPPWSQDSMSDAARLQLGIF